MKLSYNQHKVVASFLFMVFLLAAANYHLELGFLGRYAKVVMILTLGFLVVYCAYFMPTRKEIREHLRSSEGARSGDEK